MPSSIDAATVAAYRRALYHVRGPAAFTLRIDQSSPEPRISNPASAAVPF